MVEQEVDLDLHVYILYKRYKHIAEESPHIYIHVNEVLSDVFVF
jgi:hypothetical protein